MPTSSMPTSPQRRRHRGACHEAHGNVCGSAPAIDRLDASSPATGGLIVDGTLLPVGERVLAAVSGGGDSMALLLALWQCRYEFVVAHINHKLRGPESDEDERFVVAHCERLGVPVVRACAPLQQAVPRSGSRPFSEAAARVARYAALLHLARENNCRLIATGHTASDTLETFFINLLRGATVEGLGGIKPQRQLADGITVVRPLWQTTRDEARRACREAGWSWREDSSNQSAYHLRNRVRRELLPLLGELTGTSREAHAANLERLTRQVARAAMLWRDDIEWMDGAAQRQLAAITLRDARSVSGAGKVTALDGHAFVALPVALQRRVLRAAARQVKGDLQDIGAEPIERARRHIAANGRRAVWQWRGGVRVEWTGAMAGNRIRLWLVQDAQRNAASHTAIM